MPFAGPRRGAAPPPGAASRCGADAGGSDYRRVSSAPDWSTVRIYLRFLRLIGPKKLIDDRIYQLTSRAAWHSCVLTLSSRWTYTARPFKRGTQNIRSNVV
eukprot:6347404-Pyramimonas_sp.AAC.1